MILWATLALASPTHPCAGPVEAARRVPDAAPALLAIDASCQTTAWHDAMGIAFQRMDVPSVAAWHFAQCAAVGDPLQDVCLMQLARVSRQTGSTLDVRDLVIDAAPDALRPEERDYLLLQQGLARRGEGRLEDARVSLEAVQPRSTWSLFARLEQARLAEAEGRRGDALALYTALVAEVDPSWGELRDDAKVGVARLLAGVGRHDEAVAVLAGVDQDDARIAQARSWLALGRPAAARAALSDLEAWSPQAAPLRARSRCSGPRGRRGLRRAETELQSQRAALRSILGSASAGSAWQTWAQDRWGLRDDIAERLRRDDAVRAALGAVAALEHEGAVVPGSVEVQQHMSRTLHIEGRRRQGHAAEQLRRAASALLVEVDATLRGLQDGCP